MPVERFCKKDGCPGGDGCINVWRTPGQPCTMEYVADPNRSQYNWRGEGPPPPRWTAPDGTIVYRSYSDYCD